jgi:uncharacterized membrane protein
MPVLDYIGHFHPLLVHLPIGILLFAIMMMAYERVTRTDLRAAISLAWLLGGISALLASGAGWLLSRSGEYDADRVQLHQWTGLATAAMSLLTWFWKQHRWIPAVSTVVLLTVAGHYGGTLTHGDDYLSFGRKASKDVEPQQPTPGSGETIAMQTDSNRVGEEQPQIRRTFLYRDQVLPILEANCYGCHSSRKKKGGLRLDSEAFIRQGGKNGSVLLAGNPQKSKLFSYLLLPHDDELHMPPKGKRPLNAQQIALIHHWIKKGASFREEIEVISVGEQATVAQNPVTTPLIGLPLEADTLTSRSQEVLPEQSGELAVLNKPIEAPNPTVLANLKQQQITFSRLGDAGNYLTANFVNVKELSQNTLSQLSDIGQQLVQLRLSNQPVDDAAIRQLGVLPNLTRLSLEHTRITDASLTHLRNLPRLEQLNLYGTAVTDAGLTTLAAFPSLKVVYLWQTQTTPTGIERLRKANPKLRIETGGLQLSQPDTNKTL